MLPEGAASPPEEFRRLLETAAPGFGFSLSESVAAGLGLYLAQLDIARRITNLTGPLPAEELTIHALESVLGEQLISHGARLIDIGSGAGFPGLPLAIARPDLAVTLLEPRAKRASFLRQAVQAVRVGNARVEEGWARDLPAAAFDIAASRAVGGIERVLAEALFLVERGTYLAWTTGPEHLLQVLESVYDLESVLPVPGSGRRVIARFRKRCLIDESH